MALMKFLSEKTFLNKFLDIHEKYWLDREIKLKEISMYYTMDKALFNFILLPEFYEKLDKKQKIKVIQILIDNIELRLELEEKGKLQFYSKKEETPKSFFNQKLLYYKEKEKEKSKKKFFDYLVISDFCVHALPDSFNKWYELPMSLRSSGGYEEKDHNVLATELKNLVKQMKKNKLKKACLSFVLNLCYKKNFLGEIFFGIFTRIYTLKQKAGFKKSY